MSRNLLYEATDVEPYKVYIKGVFDPIIVLPGHRLIIEVERMRGTHGQELFETKVWREEGSLQGD